MGPGAAPVCCEAGGAGASLRAPRAGESTKGCRLPLPTQGTRLDEDTGVSQPQSPCVPHGCLTAGEGRQGCRGQQECRDKGTMHHRCYALKWGCLPRDPLWAPSSAHAPLSPTLKAQMSSSKAIRFTQPKASVRRSLRTALRLPPEQTAPQQSGFTFAPPGRDSSRTNPNPNPHRHPAWAGRGDAGCPAACEEREVTAEREKRAHPALPSPLH